MDIIQPLIFPARVISTMAEISPYTAIIPWSYKRGKSPSPPAMFSQEVLNRNCVIIVMFFKETVWPIDNSSRISDEYIAYMKQYYRQWWNYCHSVLTYFFNHSGVLRCENWLAKPVVLFGHQHCEMVTKRKQWDVLAILALSTNTRG